MNDLKIKLDNDNWLQLALKSDVSGTDPFSLSLKENISNKITSISSSSTDDQYPSAKAVYDYIDAYLDEINSVLESLL